ncbi:MAG: hypothetical protein WBX19_09645 [Terracidiphilus sp.]
MVAPSVEGVKTVRRGADRLAAELQKSWDMLASLTTRLAEASAPLHASRIRTGALDVICEQYTSDTHVVVTDPLEAERQRDHP